MFPKEIQDLNLSDAKTRASINISNACDKKSLFRERMLDAQVLNDTKAISQIQAEAAGWQAKQTRLLAALDGCQSVDDIAKLLAGVSGYLDGLDALVSP